MMITMKQLIDEWSKYPEEVQKNTIVVTKCSLIGTSGLPQFKNIQSAQMINVIPCFFGGKIYKLSDIGDGNKSKSAIYIL